LTHHPEWFDVLGIVQSEQLPFLGCLLDHVLEVGEIRQKPSWVQFEIDEGEEVEPGFICEPVFHDDFGI
jgi:hypothetical protein